MKCLRLKILLHYVFHLRYLLLVVIFLNALPRSDRLHFLMVHSEALSYPMIHDNRTPSHGYSRDIWKFREYRMPYR